MKPRHHSPSPGRRHPAPAPAGTADRSRRNGPLVSRGFTLIEVLAAILLLAVAFTALLGVAGASTALTQNAANRSQAALWARSLLDGAFVATPPQPGHSSGRFDRKFSWQLDVTPWDAGAGNAGAGSQAEAGAPERLRLYQLDLEVSWGTPDRPQAAHFRTLQLVQAPGSAGGLP